MEAVNRLIGRNSYFSWTMLKLYYFGNDMEDASITERQHREFYEGDQVTGAFARYYCDNISLRVLFLPAFVIVDLMLRDKHRKMQGSIYPKTFSSAKLICTRYAVAVCMTILPILVLPIKSLFELMRYCGSISVQADALAFVKYTLAWILPTVLLIMAISLLVTALLENYTAILLAGLIWLIGKPTIDKLEGGNYGLFDLIIRHNTLKGYGRMMENIQMLALNRIIISVAALALMGLAVLVYRKKRKGGLIFGRQKSVHHHKCKFTAEHQADPFPGNSAPACYSDDIRNIQPRQHEVCGLSGTHGRLIGLPMYVPLLKPEQEVGMDAIITLRSFPYRIITMLRVVLSLICTVALILVFEGYMRIGGCLFPAPVFALRTLAVTMTLGFVGLLASAVSRNTVVGFLVSFCWYCVLQVENIGAIFKSVSNGIGVYQLLLLLGSGAAIIFFSGLPFEKKGHST